MAQDYGELIQIPGGKITLRDDRIKHSWDVEIRPFRLAKFPVTQAFYFEVTGERPGFFQGDHRPVENVSWEDAVRFCNLLSAQRNLQPAEAFRLPTEAEWQYACQAGTNKPRYGELEDIAWYKANSKEETHDVGKKAANAWGLHDMLGNVWEWCADLYDTDAYGSYHIFRGGGWSDGERGCLATNRRRSHPTFKIEDLGFRVAR